MAHAYETFAEGGRRVFDPVLGAPHKGPTGIAQIYCPSVCPHKNLIAHPDYERVLPASIAAVVHDMLTGVVQHGTGTSAEISGVDVAGKTGTTTDYADAWFVGWTPELTTAVWVGYPNKLVPMTTAYNGAAGRGRDLPGDHLAQLHGPGAADPGHREPAPEDHDRHHDRHDQRAVDRAEPERHERHPDRTTPAAPTGGATGNTGGGAPGTVAATGERRWDRGR